MRELALKDLSLVAGGNVEACKSDILAATAVFGTAGGIIGGALGSVVPVVGTAGGASLGTGVGMLFGGSWAASNSPNCLPQNQAGTDYNDPAGTNYN